MIISRPSPAISGTIKCAPSNYFRNLDVEQNITSKGREYVVSKNDLNLIAGFGIPKRGDTLVDAELGRMVLSEVREMYDLGGAILGFRLRTT
jgi:hypothetical protein